jgi:uncharacterized protein (DUF362 family)
MKLIEFNDFQVKRIVIKINLCGLRGPETGAITHPLFLEAILKWLRLTVGNEVQIAVVESNATTSLPSLFIDWLGFKDVLRKWNAKFVNLSKAPGDVKIKEGILKGQRIPDIFNDCYFISLAKLKTHQLTKISCALKNQFGCIPYYRKIIFHKCLDEAIVEANKFFRPDLAIVDGIIALVGTQGPSYGVPVRAGVVIGSKDPVACDSLCAKILGFSPLFIKHIRLSEKAKIGTTKYNIIGGSVGFKINPYWSTVESYLLRLGARLSNRARKEESQW